MGDAWRGALDAEVGAIIEGMRFAVALAGLKRDQATDLDRYARYEYGDREATWLLFEWIHQCRAADASCDSENNGGLLRRLTQAIASIM